MGAGCEKTSTFSDQEKKSLLNSTKAVLLEMSRRGGRVILEKICSEIPEVIKQN